MKPMAVLATILVAAGLATAPVSARSDSAGGKAGHKAERKTGGGDVDPDAALARAHGGHVWVSAEPLPSSDGGRLDAWLGQHPPKAEITATGKDGTWSVNYLAVFKKPSVRGAMTVQFVEKGDARGLVDQYSPENGGASVVYRGVYDLSPDQGFNKGHTYLIKVGQLLKGKFVLYAVGELALK